MEKNFIVTDELLWDYADGLLAVSEKQQIDAYLLQHPAQKAQLDAILAEKRAFTTVPLEKPNSDFAKQVMAAWVAEQSPLKASVPAKAKGQDWVLWGIAAGMVAMLFVPLWLAPNAVPTDLSLQIPEEYMPQLQVPAFDWQGLFGGAWLRTLLLITMALMSLKILDKYLQVRNLSLQGH